jgi:hypothetical protein
MTTVTLFLVVLELLLPGYAWILASGLHKELSTLEKVLLSFVLSICFSSLVAAALAFLTPSYLLLSTVLSLGGTAVLIVAYVGRRRPTKPAKQQRFSLSTGSRALDFCILAYAVLILGLFWSAPYYPTAQAPDLLTHAQLISSIVSGEGRNVLLESGYPFGLHFAAAIISSLVNIGALQALRVVASAALFATVPLFFLSAREVLGNAKAAGAALLVATFAMPADALHLFRIGTFPNLMSDMIILTVVWLVFRYVKTPSRGLGLTLTFLGVGGAFMHSSFLIILGVFWVAALFAFILHKDEARMYVKATSFSTLGLAVFALLAFFSFHANLQRLAASYVVVGGATVFRIALDEFARSLLTFMGPVNVAAIICAGFLALKLRKNLGSVFSFTWLLLMVPGALVSGEAYRFILFAMLPGSYLMGQMLTDASNLLGSFRSTMPKLTKTTEVLILLLLIVSGVFPSIAAESFNPSGRSHQSAVYDSMIWVEHNSSCSTGVASAGLWPDYEYLPALTGVRYAGDFIRPADYVLQKSASLGFHCLVVARNSEYFQQFANDPSFRESYQNELAIVFAVA